MKAIKTRNGTLSSLTYDDVDCLIKADTEAAQQDFDSIVRFIPPGYSFNTCKEFRGNMILAMKLLKLHKEGACSIDDMQNLGITFEKRSDAAKKGLLVYDVSYRQQIQNDIYREFLEQAMDNLWSTGIYSDLTPDGLCLWMQASINLPQAARQYEKTVTTDDIALSFFDALTNLHMHGLYPVSTKGKLSFEYGSLFTALWWRMYEKVANSQLLICPVCGVPFFAPKSRGKQRKYCSNACKQHAYDERQETRANS